jgi:hypothetical protein
MKIPRGLRPIFRKTELRYSLKTGYLGQAKSQARLMAGLLQFILQPRKNGSAHRRIKGRGSGKQVGIIFWLDCPIWLVEISEE